MAKGQLTNLDEHRFWLQIFGDQNEIIRSRLDPEYTAEIDQAIKFRDIFYGLYNQARQEILSAEQMSKLIRDASKAVYEYMPFLVQILRKQLFEKYYTVLLPVYVIKNGLPPDFPQNHEIVLEVYDRLISYATFVVGTMKLVEQKKMPSTLSHIFPDYLSDTLLRYNTVVC